MPEKFDECPFETNDVVTLRSIMKAGTKDFKAQINWVEDRGEFWYYGYTPDDPMNGAWGCARQYKDETTRQWGTFFVENHGKRARKTLPDFPCLKGNPGYDLMM
jgi:hypothetical protein